MPTFTTAIYNDGSDNILQVPHPWNITSKKTQVIFTYYITSKKKMPANWDQSSSTTESGSKQKFLVACSQKRREKFCKSKRESTGVT